MCETLNHWRFFELYRLPYCIHAGSHTCLVHNNVCEMLQDRFRDVMLFLLSLSCTSSGVNVAE